MHPMLITAVKAARSAGKIIMRHSHELDRLTVETKGRNDYVSQVDQRAEAVIIDTIRKTYPEHAILAEESGRHSGDEFEWIVDPLDGTTNYLHGYPQFAVSIAVYHRGNPYQAVVFDPARDELFTASRGEGAQLNDRRIRVSAVTRLDAALLATGFPFKSMAFLEPWIETFRVLLPRTSGVRRAGSAALDLAHVACGRLDGFWEFGLKPWDMAAGCLLIQEAGGRIGDFAGLNNYLNSGNLVAGSPRIYTEILHAIKPCLPNDLHC